MHTLHECSLTTCYYTITGSGSCTVVWHTIHLHHSLLSVSFRERRERCACEMTTIVRAPPARISNGRRTDSSTGNRYVQACMHMCCTVHHTATHVDAMSRCRDPVIHKSQSCSPDKPSVPSHHAPPRGRSDPTRSPPTSRTVSSSPSEATLFSDGEIG
jgi:hypothetical protein